jgi:DNA-binding GntR family transcriptional regulator
MVWSDTESLMDKAYLKIKNMLLTQEIAQGRKLVYRELAKKFHMSSTPVQLALGKLEQEGLVEREHNVGYFVRRISVKENDDLFDVRRILEVYAIKEAINNQTPQDIKLLTELAQNHKNYKTRDFDRTIVLLDSEFHLQIVKMSRNYEILKQIRRIYEHTYLRYPPGCVPPTRLLITPSQHEEILHWIKERDISHAQTCLGKHIWEAKEAKRLALCAFSHEL